MKKISLLITGLTAVTVLTAGEVSFEKFKLTYDLPEKWIVNTLEAGQRYLLSAPEDSVVIMIEPFSAINGDDAVKKISSYVKSLCPGVVEGDFAVEKNEKGALAGKKAAILRGKGGIVQERKDEEDGGTIVSYIPVKWTSYVVTLDEGYLHVTVITSLSASDDTKAGAAALVKGMKIVKAAEQKNGDGKKQE